MATAVSRATDVGRRLATETKQAFKTTEFWAYVGVLVAVLIAGIATSGEAGTADTDGFPADDVWLYATILTVGYMISRGLAKAGSRDPYDDGHDHAAGGNGARHSIGDRAPADDQFAGTRS